MSSMSAFMEEHFGTAEENKAKLFAVMKEHGVSYLEAYYYGGNDEGGVQEVEVLKDASGGTITIESMGWQHPIQEACDRVLSGEFGTWAGDFSASGRLYADMKENKVWRAGQQSVDQADSNEY